MKERNAEEVIGQLVPGTILWREFHIISMAGIAVPECGEMAKAHREGYVAKLELPGKWCYEPTVTVDLSRKGVFLFIEEQPPVNWNFLVVKSVAKARNAVFAEYQRSSKAYGNWCRNSFMLKRDHLNTDAEKVYELVQQQLPMNLPEGLSRLFVHHLWRHNEGHLITKWVAEKIHSHSLVTT